MDGKPASLDKHEYLREVYQDDHPDQTWIKATQMGCSTEAILDAIYSLRFLDYTGILYTFPSQGHAVDFSKSKITPLVESNPAIQEAVRETDASTIKNISGNFLFLRGMKSRGGLKTLPCDMVCFDEWDEAERPEEAMALAKERLAHSQHKRILRLSNPTMVDYAIDKEFQKTDQRFWLLICPGCGEYNNLVDAFPDCLVERKGEVIRACRKCGKELDTQKGEWVAKSPQVKAKRGRQFSQLHSEFVPSREILEEYRTTDNLTEFFNLKIGVAHTESTSRLSVPEVLELCGDEMNASGDQGPCSLGCDVGKLFHIVIGKRDPLCGKGQRIVHVGVCESWEDLHSLMKRFHISRALIDGLPDQRGARAFAEAHPGRVYLAYYQGHRKGHPLWNDRDFTLSVDRTEALDACRHQIQTQNVLLPRRSESVEEFAQHLSAVAKRLDTDPETGASEYKYIRLSDDHYAHAFCYQCLAASKMARLAFNV